MNEQTKERIAGVALAVLVIAGVAYLWNSANVRAEQAEAMSACVVAEAEAEGYTGNPYSREAWDIFAEGCAK